MITGQVTATLGADWGNWSARVSAGTSVFALVVATIGGVFAFLSFKRQGVQIAQLKQDKRAEQIALLAVWMDGDGQHYRVVNDSRLPVWGLMMCNTIDSLSACMTPMAQVEPGNWRTPLQVPLVARDLGNLVSWICVDNLGTHWVRWGPLPTTEVTEEQFDALYRELNASGDFRPVDRKVLRDIYPKHFAGDENPTVDSIRAEMERDR